MTRTSAIHRNAASLTSLTLRQHSLRQEARGWERADDLLPVTLISACILIKAVTTRSMELDHIGTLS